MSNYADIDSRAAFGLLFLFTTKQTFMGLSMILNKKTYVRNWSYMEACDRHAVAVVRGGEPRTEILPERISYIIEEVASWQKADAIHYWFVRNVQDGSDDCKEYRVTRNKLVELLATLKQVKSDHARAPILLPTGNEYFTGYDTWYFDQVDRSIDVTLQTLSGNRWRMIWISTIRRPGKPFMSSIHEIKITGLSDLFHVHIKTELDNFRRVHTLNTRSAIVMKTLQLVILANMIIYSVQAQSMGGTDDEELLLLLAILVNVVAIFLVFRKYALYFQDRIKQGFFRVHTVLSGIFALVTLSFGFWLYWMIVAIILWVIDGFKNERKSFTTEDIPNIDVEAQRKARLYDQANPK